MTVDLSKAREGQIAHISLTNGKIAIVDAEDFDFLNKWKWCFMAGYAMRKKYLGVSNGKQKFKNIIMHRLINNTPDGMETDHVNGDVLDNRKCNLRSCTVSQNQFNQRKSGINTYSKHKGVTFDKRKMMWIAQIQKNKKRTHLGYFSTEENAKLAYNSASRDLHGVFSNVSPMSATLNENKKPCN